MREKNVSQLVVCSKEHLPPAGLVLAVWEWPVNLLEILVKLSAGNSICKLGIEGALINLVHAKLHKPANKSRESVNALNEMTTCVGRFDD